MVGAASDKHRSTGEGQETNVQQITTNAFFRGAKTMSRRPLIAGNWKMNGSRAEADEPARGIASLNRNETAESLVCPPYPYLGLVADALPGSTVGQ